MIRTVMISAALAAMATTSTPALASGSGGGGGGGFGGGFSSSRVPSAQTQQQRDIRRGKSQVRKRITCKKCEYHDRLDRNTASEVAQAVRSGKFDIKADDRSKVLLYLRDRYGV